MRTISSISLVSLALFAGACDQGPATLRIAAWGEALAEDRIPAAMVVDGWEIELERFLVAIGEVEADGEPLEGAFVVDLAQPSGGAGHELGTLTLPAGGRPVLGYRIAPLADDTPREGLDDAAARLLDARASMWLEGRGTKDGRTVRFAWPFDTDVRYADCRSTTDLVDGETARTRLTLHAARPFHDDLDGERANVAFDIVAEADRNADGEVSVPELWETTITGRTRYQAGDRDIVDLWTFMEELALAIGHVDGEGECAIAGDGEG